MKEAKILCRPERNQQMVLSLQTITITITTTIRAALILNLILTILMLEQITLDSKQAWPDSKVYCIV